MNYSYLFIILWHLIRDKPIWHAVIYPWHPPAINSPIRWRRVRQGSSQPHWCSLLAGNLRLKLQHEAQSESLMRDMRAQRKDVSEGLRLPPCTIITILIKNAWNQSETSCHVSFSICRGSLEFMSAPSSVSPRLLSASSALSGARPNTIAI